MAEQLPPLPQELIDALANLTGGNELLAALAQLAYSESPELEEAVKRTREMLLEWKNLPRN